MLFGTIPSLCKSFFHRLFRKQRVTEADWRTAENVPFRSKIPIVTWIGHATVLIQINNVNILTDPVFGQVYTFFPRLTSPGIQLELLPSIDYILLSHNHWDHMDKPSLRALKKRHPHLEVLVPLGCKEWFLANRFTVSEYSWWQQENKKITFTFLPAIHWSGRGLFDQNRSLWGSWMITYNDTHIYFAGDTAYGKHFSQIYDEFKSIDIAILPISPGLPKKWMARTHMDAVHALRAFDDLQAQRMIPVHWGAFSFGNDQFDEQFKLLQSTWQNRVLPGEKQLVALKMGQKYSLSTPNL